tara:strand:- start:58 stop:1938 length:1881 start_codon:yes stop_codon:yes gene_type:complete
MAPFINAKEIVKEKPILVYIQDESSSLVSNSDSNQVRALLEEEIPLNLKLLEDKFQIKKIFFDQEIRNKSQGQNGIESNISLGLKEARQRFYNQNVGAVILASDGIFNRGINPVYEAQSLNFPIYSLGIGDSSLRKDLFIQGVIHNEISYLNNSFPLEIKIRARDLVGETSNLTIKDERGKKVFSQKININQLNDFQSIELFLNPDSIGLQQYNISLNPIEGELEKRNNYRTFNIEVVDNRKKILILGKSPHPDIAALNSALKNFEKYEVDISLEKDFDINQKPPELYILHSPSARVLDLVGKKNIPYWIFYGSQTNSSSFSRLTGIVGLENNFENTLTYSESSFKLFNLDEEWATFSKKLPPIQSPFGKIRVNSPLDALFYKRIKRIESGEPLWFFSKDADKRTCIFLGEGIWNWRMYDFRQNSNFLLFDNLIASTVQYLTSKSEDERFRVDLDKKYNVNSQISIDARLYNESLELSNQAEVNIEIQSSEGQNYNYTLGKTALAYKSNIGKLAQGDYNWKAFAKLGEEEFSRKGSFSVVKSDLEQLDLVARHQILRQLSKETGGEFYKSDQLDQMIEALKNSNSSKAIQREETNISSLLNKKWIFFTLLILLGLEWGFRKFFGKY